MKNHHHAEPLSRTCNEYMLVAKPHAELSAAIRHERQRFDQCYGVGLGVKSKPRVTIGKFLATEHMEPTLIAWLQRICGGELSFSIMLNNFSGCPVHTIYLRVQNQQPLLQLAKKLQQIDSYVAGNTGHQVQWNPAPHITIAKGLPEAVYASAMAVYAKQEFTSEFVVKELLLMRRTDPQAAADTVAVLALRPELAPMFQQQQLYLF
jgi:2'-5' RNA ligase